METAKAALREVHSNADALAAALRRLSGSNRVAQSILELLERDIARLSSAIDGDNRQAVLIALAFPSLDGRAADALGGFDFENTPETGEHYRRLNKALVAALEVVNGETE